MRLLIVGGLQGQIGAATKIAMDRGAKVTHAADIEQALASAARRRAAPTWCSATSTLDIGALVRGACRRTHLHPGGGLRRRHRHPPRRGRDPRRRQGISAPARRSRTDRRGAGGGRRRIPPADL